MKHYHIDYYGSKLLTPDACKLSAQHSSQKSNSYIQVLWENDTIQKTHSQHEARTIRRDAVLCYITRSSSISHSFSIISLFLRHSDFRCNFISAAV